MSLTASKPAHQCLTKMRSIARSTVNEKNERSTFIVQRHQKYHTMYELVSNVDETTTTELTEQKNFNYIEEWNISTEQPGHEWYLPAEKVHRPKIILVWNSFFGEWFSQDNLKACPNYHCTIMHDRAFTPFADSILFHVIETNLEDLPAHRFFWQRYVFFTLESPLNTPSQWPPGFFNWTMGYRKDSDIYSPYGFTIKRSKPVKKNFAQIYNKKRKPVAWFVSNCEAKRERYVNELAKYIPVDIYGACGTKRCDKGTAYCDDLINDNYYFYLAFENSVCKDYISEKFWLRANDGEVVLVVLSRWVLGTLAHPDSFIAADDFAGPKELADHLTRVMQDKDLYIKYLQYQELYEPILLTSGDPREKATGFCELCRKLWLDKKTKIYSDMTQWWVTDGACDTQLIDNLLEPKASTNIKHTVASNEIM